MAENNLIPADEIDIVEQSIQDICPTLLKILLSDKTTKKFIRWGSDNYVAYGPEYRTDQEIEPKLITGNHTDIIQPRVLKPEEQRTKRTRDNAEVFTPSWVCNEQNNLVDAAWFGRENVFNIAGDKAKKAPVYTGAFLLAKTQRTGTAGAVKSSSATVALLLGHNLPPAFQGSTGGKTYSGSVLQRGFQKGS